MKTQILIFIYLLLFIPPVWAENQSEQEGQNQQQSEPQKKDADEIDKYIVRLRINIEKEYSLRLVELNRQSQSEIRLLEVPDKAATGTASLAAQAEVAKAVLDLDKYGYRTLDNIMGEVEKVKDPGGVVEAYDKLSDKITISPRRFVAAQSQIAERKSQILARLEWETLDLEQQKQYALTVSLPQLEKQLKENLLKPEPEATHGVVTGIFFSADKSSAIVDREIVHNGDAIYGVTVTKIYKDRVEFEKNGKKWQQKVQQTPEDYWK